MTEMAANFLKLQFHNILIGPFNNDEFADFVRSTRDAARQAMAGESQLESTPRE
jgi:hypothetical protein